MHSIANDKPEVSIVLVGDFNPAAFQPAWFALEDLLPCQEVADAKINVIHGEITEFSIDWMTLQSTKERFQVKTAQASHYEALRDLVISTFRVMKYTTIRNLGINFEVDYMMADMVIRDKLGDMLAPKVIWNKVVEVPKLKRLHIESKRPDEYKGNINVYISPSLKSAYGVLFNINDHYEVNDNDKVEGALEILDILSSTWYDSLDRSQNIIKGILEEV